MKAIFKRELRSYFTTMLGYIFLTMFFVMTGVLFYWNNICGGLTSVKYFFDPLTTWTVFIIPILTMRLFAEDRKLKIDQLLMTSPVDVKSIVLGKFLAASCVVGGAIALTLIYVIVISFFGTVNWAETISCYIGFLLLCGVMLAIGSFMSSLTDSQIVAAVSTYAVLIVFCTVPLLIGYISAISWSVPSLVQSVMFWLSPTERFLDLTKGILDPSAIVYYISLITLFVFLTMNVMERRRLS